MEQRSQRAIKSNLSSEKLLHIIEILSEQDEPVRLVELSKMAKMNESTVFRYLSSLQNCGWAMQDADSGRYTLSYKICAVAANVSSRKSIRSICTPFLRSLAEIFCESVNVAEEHDMAAVYIDAVSGPRQQLLMTTRRVGNVSPLHCTAVGKLLLLGFSPRRIDLFIATKGLAPLTDKTITTREELLEELERVRERGFAFDDEEYEPGARCVAAPLYDYTGNVVAGISVSGPANRMSDEHIYSKLPYLLDAAREISIRLGWKAPEEVQF
jgi:DNA-binding IclR family transcriptional regulator